MAKDIAKSIRISQEVYDYIVESPGKGFNDKFEKIILEAKKDEPRRKRELKRLEDSINEEQRKLKELIARNRYMEDFYRKVIHMNRQLTDLEQALNLALAEGTETKQND